MPYNLRRNANGRRESRSNDNETRAASPSIETAESVNPTTFASLETELDLEKRVTAVVDMMMAQTWDARQSAQTSLRKSRRESGGESRGNEAGVALTVEGEGVSNAHQGGDNATTQDEENPHLKALLDRVRDHYHQRGAFLQKEMVKLTLLHEINMENLFTVEADRPINDQWEVRSDYAETEVDGDHTSGVIFRTSVIHSQL